MKSLFLNKKGKQNTMSRFEVVIASVSCSSGYVQKLTTASANLQLALFSSGFTIQFYCIRYEKSLNLCLWESTIKYRRATLTI
jgi:hypothetical protein